MHRDTRTLLDELDRTYEALHTAKEDAFWRAKMGLADDAALAQEELSRREIEWQAFLTDPDRLRAVREAALPDDDGDRTRLAGWRATFEAHAIESGEARALAAEIVEAEGRLEHARGRMELGYRHPDRGFTRASSVELGTMLRGEPREDLRRAAWDGLRSIEPYVIDAGFLEVVRMRNRLGRSLGAEDYYDWKTKSVERMSKRAVFERLDDLEERTRERARASIDELRARHGADAVTPWSVQYLVRGDVTREEDPYFPFRDAIDRWGRSFAALGIEYRGAELVLDLVDRPGKYENGFMHGPVVAWRTPDGFQPARIHFTANAIPGMVGSGLRAMETLFHEGGHAAHFANIDMPSPCFGQEFAPTSVGFSETQSMFLDSFLGDAEWRARYARSAAGEPIPWALVERGIRASQPFAAWSTRAMLAVCYGERALYEIPDAELTPERALEELRAVERRLTLLEEGSPRPILSVPHLLAGDSSAYYHGYVLAEMAVQQTRAHFLGRDGHLTDNSRIGPELREAYWQPGNSLEFDAFLERLTGRPLAADDLAAGLNEDTEAKVARERVAFERARAAGPKPGGVRLDARVRVVHGRSTVAELDGDFDAFAGAFAEWVDAQAAAEAGKRA